MALLVWLVLGGALAMLVLGAHVQAQGPVALHVLVQHQSAPRSDVEAGLRFGAAEVSRTLQLLGHELRIVFPSVNRPADQAASSGTGGAAIHTAGEAVWLLLAGAPPAAPDIQVDACRFEISVPARRRAAVRAAWLARASLPDDEQVRVVEWHPALKRSGAAQLNERYTRATGMPMTAGAWVAWAAVKAVAEASVRKAADEKTCDAVTKLELDGHKGHPLRFDAEARELRQPLYVVRGDDVLAEIDHR
jgi:hypothetical protein